MAGLAAMGRGFPVRHVRVPIVPQAIIFDLLNGGDKSALQDPDARPYYRLGREALHKAKTHFELGSHGAGYGATLPDLKGGLGSASTLLPDGTRMGALVAVNAVGQVTIGDRPHSDGRRCGLCGLHCIRGPTPSSGWEPSPVVQRRQRCSGARCRTRRLRGKGPALC